MCVRVCVCVCVSVCVRAMGVPMRVHRKIITPNLGFMEKLMDYEEEKRGTDPSVDINKYSSWYTSTDQAAVPDLRPE